MALYWKIFVFTFVFGSSSLASAYPINVKVEGDQSLHKTTKVRVAIAPGKDFKSKCKFDQSDFIKFKSPDIKFTLNIEERIKSIYYSIRVEEIAYKANCNRTRYFHARFKQDERLTAITIRLSKIGVEEISWLCIKPLAREKDSLSNSNSREKKPQEKYPLIKTG